VALPLALVAVVGAGVRGRWTSTWSAVSAIAVVRRWRIELAIATGGDKGVLRGGLGVLHVILLLQKQIGARREKRVWRIAVGDHRHRTTKLGERPRSMLITWDVSRTG
jgi:hypothetical protein